MFAKRLIIATVLPLLMLHLPASAALDASDTWNAAPAMTDQGARGVTYSTSNDGRTGTCADYHSTFGTRETARGEKRLDVAGNRLTVNASDNGGVRLQRSSTGAFSITACMAAAGTTVAEAAQSISQISVTERGGVVTVDGPESSQWNVQLIVAVPDGASVDASAQNGPLSVDGVDATLMLNVKNGPLSLANSRGRIEARAVNGPLSLAGMSGDIDASVDNGPLTVLLDDNAWLGGDLRASVGNGPLTLRLPSGYGSGVVLDASGHGPFACALPECQSIQMSSHHPGLRRPQKVHLGSGDARVFIRGGNGPITISEGR